jgi:competence protein ComEC
MFESVKKYGLLYLFSVLLLVVIFIFYLDWQGSQGRLTFAMLDVGQGDALFIESPTGTQILVDGGPPKKILSSLAPVMSPFDKSIDAIIITNPDQDHMAGFLDILNTYKVGSVFESGTFNDSKTYQNLEDEIINKNIPRILAKKGMTLDLGGGAFLEILFPDRDVSLWERNDGSIISKLVYGDNNIMLTGDATSKTEQIVLSENKKEYLKSSILKIGHHGSRTSTSLLFAQAVSPFYALISDGKDNKYGHPHRETLDTLDKVGAKVLRTDLLGTIIFTCDRMGLCEIN